MQKLTERHKQILIAVAVSLASMFIYLGFDSSPYKIEMCTSTVTRYVTAEYSEVTFGTDAEGNPTTETDYWSEPASQVWNETVRNVPAVYPPMPPTWTGMSSDPDFDNFQNHTDTSLIITATADPDITTFQEPISKVPDCLIMIGHITQVKTWYSITYGTDFMPDVST